MEKKGKKSVIMSLFTTSGEEKVGQGERMRENNTAKSVCSHGKETHRKKVTIIDKIQVILLIEYYFFIL